MKPASAILTLLLLIFQSSMAHTDTETRGLVRIKDSQGQQVGLYKDSHALLIGVSNYTAGWPDLLAIPTELDQV